MVIPQLRLDHKGNKGLVFAAEAWEAEVETANLLIRSGGVKCELLHDFCG